METEKEVNELVGSDEAAQILHVPKSTLMIYNSQRKISYHKLGRKVFYKKSDLANFIESRRRPALLEK